MSSVTDSNSSGISVLNAVTLEEVVQLSTPHSVKMMTVSRDGKRLAAYCAGGEAKIWRTDDWGPISITEPKGSGGMHGRAMDFLGNGDRTAMGWGHGKVSIHDSATGDKLREFAVHKEGVTALAISPRSDVMATGAGYSDTTVKLWNPETGETVGELTGHQAWISGVAFSPDGALLASSSADQTIRLWDTKTRAAVATLRGHED